MNKRGFDEKFFAELYDYMNDRQTDSEFREMLWHWIEQYGTEQRIDELTELKELHPDPYWTKVFENRIKELKDE